MVQWKKFIMQPKWSDSSPVTGLSASIRVLDVLGFPSVVPQGLESYVRAGTSLQVRPYVYKIINLI